MQDAAKPDFAALPVAEEDFVELRNLGKIYVDKTDLIYKLAANTFPIFMARPRRFGKSLLCSTLADLFANGTENFKGLVGDLINSFQVSLFFMLTCLGGRKDVYRALAVGSKAT